MEKISRKYALETPRGLNLILVGNPKYSLCIQEILL